MNQGGASEDGYLEVSVVAGRAWGRAGVSVVFGRIIFVQRLQGASRSESCEHC